MHNTHQFGELQTHLGSVDESGLARRQNFVVAKVEQLHPDAHAVSVRYSDGGAEIVMVVGNQYNLPKVGEWVVVGFAHGYNKPLVFGTLMMDDHPLITMSAGEAIHGKKEIHDDRYENVLSWLEWHYAPDGSLTIRLKQKTGANCNVNLIVEGAAEGEGGIHLDINGPLTIAQRDVSGNIVQALQMNNIDGQEKITVKDKSGNVIETSSEGMKLSTSKEKDQHAVFGEILVEKLTSLIEMIEALTVGTAMGNSTPPLNRADFMEIKSELDEILTEAL